MDLQGRKRKGFFFFFFGKRSLSTVLSYLLKEKRKEVKLKKYAHSCLATAPHNSSQLRKNTFFFAKYAIQIFLLKQLI